MKLDTKFHHQYKVQTAIECQPVLSVFCLPEDGLSPELYVRCHRKERLTKKANKEHTTTVSSLRVLYSLIPQDFVKDPILCSFSKYNPTQERI